MSDLLTAEALVEMQQRCDLASKPPWHLESPQDREKYGHRVYDGGAWGVCKMTRGDKPVDEVNAEFIINARDDIPALLAHAAALHARLHEVEQENRELKIIVDVGTTDDPDTALSKLHKIQHQTISGFKQRVVEAVRAFPAEANRAWIIRAIESLPVGKEADTDEK